MYFDFFPQGIATGSAFLGRESEKQNLKNNIVAGHHTLLIAPRRYGKTSLAKNVLNELDVITADVSFFLCRSANAVESKIRNCIEGALNKSERKPEKLFNALKHFFMHSKKKWTFGFKGFAGVELVPDASNEVTDNIFTALSLLDATMGELKKKAVLFFDEVQEIDLLDDGRAIQGAIREFAQQSKQVVLIFSGSNRRLLNHMFDNASMPLYELCERIQLAKIETAVYKTYLNKIARKSWSEKLDEAALNEIMQLSERHPKRVYNLCYQLWTRFPTKAFNKKDVQRCWHDFIELRLKDVRSQLSLLNDSQLKVLTLIALDYNQPITGRAAQTRLNLSSASIVKALVALESEDFISKDQAGQFTFVDPLIKAVLVQYESDNLS